MSDGNGNSGAGKFFKHFTPRSNKQVKLTGSPSTLGTSVLTTGGGEDVLVKRYVMLSTEKKGMNLAFGSGSTSGKKRWLTISKYKVQLGIIHFLDLS